MIEPFERTEIEDLLDNVIMPNLRAGVPGPKLGSWRGDIDCETAYLSARLAGDTSYNLLS
ncbi:MAG: hypothetical protein AABX03_00575 [Nanoarchaeota archaeon]